MNWKAYVVVGLILFLAVFVVSRLNHDKIPPVPLSVQVLQSTFQEASEQAKMTISVEYPRVDGLQNPTRQEDIDKKIEKMIFALIDPFKKIVIANEKELYMQKHINDPMFESNLVIRYITERVDNSIVSFSFSVSDNQAGAAHPNNYNEVFNYDVETGKMITLADLFKKDSNYLQVLSDVSIEQLNVQMKDEIKDPEIGADVATWIKTGAAPSADNFQKFVIQKDALVIVFDPYQVAAYVYGTRRVTIPFTKLTDSLQDRFKKDVN